MNLFIAQFLIPETWAAILATITVVQAVRGFWRWHDKKVQVRQFLLMKLDKALQGTEWGVTWSSYVMPGGFMIGWNAMANAYQKYITGLPLERRHEIIDRLLDNQMVKCQRDGIDHADLASLIGLMNVVEIETLMCTVMQGEVDWQERQVTSYGSNELANDIIAFRFSNPC